MHKETGAIAHFETEQDANDAGYELISKLSGKMPEWSTSGLVDTLMGMNRKQRRAWMAQRRRVNGKVLPK